MCYFYLPPPNDPALHLRAGHRAVAAEQRIGPKFNLLREWLFSSLWPACGLRVGPEMVGLIKKSPQLVKSQ